MLGTAKNLTVKAMKTQSTFSNSVFLLDLQDVGPQVLHFFETYIFADWQFLTFFLILQIMDTTLLFYKALAAKSVNMGLLGVVFQKVFIYICFLVLVHILANYTIDGQRNNFLAGLPQ
jgi:hypothetical protein